MCRGSVLLLLFAVYRSWVTSSSFLLLLCFIFSFPSNLCTYFSSIRAQDVECVLVFDGKQFVMDRVSVVGVSQIERGA